MSLVRPIEQADLPALAGLLEALSSHPANPGAMLRVFQAIRANPDYHLLGAFAGDVLAGTVMGVVCLDPVGDGRPFLVVENLVVSTAFRRQGQGRRLLDALEDRARERRCRYALLVSGAARTEAHAFYAALGYAATPASGFKKYL